MEEQNSKLAPEFEGRAAPPPDLSAEALAQVERVTVTLDIDADILAWLKQQPLDWQREINNAARFVMDMTSQPVPPIEVYEADFDLSAELLAQEETAGPDPARNADRIEHDFIP